MTAFPTVEEPADDRRGHLVSPRVHALPGHVESGGATADAVVAALDDLPRSRMSEVLSRLASAATHYEETRDTEPLIHFVDSLLMTARLHRNGAYRLRVAEVEAQHAAQVASGEAPEGVEVADFVARMRAKFGPYEE